jgi:opacity protein-like surface antigen
LAPVPGLYAGGGVGFYQVTYDYDQDRIAFDIEDRTDQEFGVHVGGGLKVPLAPSTSIDMHGRYVMMQEQDARLVPETFDPDFWNISIGMAFQM